MRQYVTTLLPLPPMPSPWPHDSVEIADYSIGLHTPFLTPWPCGVCKQVDRAVKTHRQRIKTSLLNEVLSDALMWQKPPAVKASQIGRIYYCNQVTHLFTGKKR